MQKFPELERGESASVTGRIHIPSRIFTEAAHLEQQRELLLNLLEEINPLNSRRKAAEIEEMLNSYIPGVEKMKTRLKKYGKAYKELQAENARLAAEVDSSKESVHRKLEIMQQLQELDKLRGLVENIPPELLQIYRKNNPQKKEMDRT